MIQNLHPRRQQIATSTRDLVKKSTFRRKSALQFGEPIRSEIFSATRLEDHAESLARAQTVFTNHKVGFDLPSRVRDNRRTLERCYQTLLRTVEEKRAVTPAAEWFIDNFHIVRAQLKDIHDHLPPSFYKELPKLNSGPLHGYPRVYGIAWAFVAHSDSRFDHEVLRSFLQAYQRIQPLTIGELWAVSITLRVVMIENLRRLAERISHAQEARKQADSIANELLGLNVSESRSMEKILGVIENRAFDNAFATQLLQRLRFQESKFDPVLESLENRLRLESLTSDAVVSSEHNYQTAANASVRNIITSFRLISALNWQDFFEEVSLVDRELRESALYKSMDFATRDRYRHALEQLARHSPKTELEIARELVARSSLDRDPGYFLIGPGRIAFEKEIAYQKRFRDRLTRFYKSNGSFLYIGGILAVTTIVLWLALNQLSALSPAFFTLLAAMAFFPASEIAVSIINRLTVSLLGPKLLPRLSFETGIPTAHRTFIVVPTMLNDLSKIDSQLEQLEIHYLSNPEGDLHFALLTDWTDSKTESRSDDQLLIDAINDRLPALNEKYGPTISGFPRFYVLHRGRKYNSHEGKWMGWERKRGKLKEFNEMLLGSTSTTYLPIGGAPPKLPTGVRYVITLDADTKMPKGAVARLVGTMAHPLNRPHFDQRLGRVTEGYGILQPRITPSLPSTQDSTIYQKLSTGPSGVDPYAAAVSDVYQDLFEEGSFTGKGIYEVAIFERALKDRVPENSLLSHDLFEGNLARCGFLSDVEFFEDFPSHSGVAISRSHRWTRGDWQLLPWIFGRRGHGISTIGRWKMLDNLRRSLVAPLTFFAFIACLTLPSPNYLPLLSLIILSFGISTVVSLLWDLAPNRSANFLQHIWFLTEDCKLGLGRFFLHFSLLPYQGWMSIDAVVRALFRLFISRKLLLEWTTAAQAKMAASLSLKSFARNMFGALMLTVFALLTIAVFRVQNLPLAMPFLVLWGASPLLARFFSHPPEARLLRPLHPNDIQLLHSTGRRIWRFFATFVTAEESYLPPDNFQEDPLPVVAHRSSPTNFGLYLLSVFAARDFGWIGLTETAERLDLTLKSLDNLAKHDGHFYNWYETTSGRPLDPKYISSVDNGNLAGHLLAVAQGCFEALDQQVEISGFNRGILDTLLLLEQEIGKTEAATRVSQAFSDLATSLLTPDHLIKERSRHWELLKTRAAKLVDEAKKSFEERAETARAEILEWSRALQNDIRSSASDFHSLVGWNEFSNLNLPAHFSPVLITTWEEQKMQLGRSLKLRDLPAHNSRLINNVLDLKQACKTSGLSAPEFLDPLVESLESSFNAANVLIHKFQECARLSYRLFHQMDFGLLYDQTRKLFSIGFRVGDNALDASYYDLLASEARLTSFIAIAKGDVPASHWFRLGRNLTPVENGAALISWSGSMFEYLMPSLVMHTPDGSLLEQTCRLVIERQIQYATAKGVPWGISESAYNKRDLQLTYQYSNFGVPDLGLKRGLGADLVIAPYATALAAMYESSRAAENLRRLMQVGAMGPFGFYEAVDFTPSRLPEGQNSAVIKAYMAHHQGMSLLSIANVFHNGKMKARFHAEPLVQATELLLQERTPRTGGTIKANKESAQVEVVREITEHLARRYHSYNRPIPTTQLLSNGDYTLMLSSSGSGFSRWRETALTRWREDVTRDNWGTYLFLKDCEGGQVWSATYQPTCLEPQYYEVTFAEDRAKFVRNDFDIQSHLEIFVSPEDNAEVRQLTLTNQGEEIREIEVTSYCEVVLNTQAADAAHPAFSNLFVQTEFISGINSLIASRRPRSEKDVPIWMAHTLLTDSHAFGAVEYETDRAKFIGRTRSIHDAESIYSSKRLSQTLGPVLDPCLSLRTRVRLNPGTSTTLTFSSSVALKHDDALMLAEKCHDPFNHQRVSDLAWTQAQVKLHYLDIEPDETHLFQRLATRLLYLDSSLRPSSEVLKKNVRNVTGLWAFGISGDYPIVLLRIDDLEDRGIVRQLLKAQEYLATKRITADIVILNEKSNSYAQELQLTLEAMVHSSTVGSHSVLPQSRGKVFVVRGDLLSEEDRAMLFAESRAVLSARSGSLSDQVKRTRFISQPVPPLAKKAELQVGEKPSPKPTLQFFNEIGGFSPDGKEYVILLDGETRTPSPWINVIANGNAFGFQVSESGSGYTWSQNSRENQLTPWSNDPVSDPCGEAFWIMDRDAEVLWSPTALPIRQKGGTYICRHGQGYSRFEYETHGIASELTQFAHWTSPLKISRLVIENKTRFVRNLSLTGYAEWVLGFSRATMAPTTLSEFDEISQTLWATNPRNSEHGTRVAFAGFTETPSSFTADRTEFVGRNGQFSRPAGLFSEEGLSGKTGGGFDPCAALQKDFLLTAGEKIEIIFFLGQAETREQARSIIASFKNEGAENALKVVKQNWEDLLTKVQVETPDRSFDLAINRWLLYQTLVCRFWARAAFYQAGGAFGFRDQLQDVMALMYSAPQLAREHILRAASRQFVEGDVQHWWHPPFGRGVRTQFSDDLLWLPYVVSHYLKVTGDQSILDVEVSFLEGPLLRPDQEDSYYTPNNAPIAAPLYDHCVRAIDRSLKTGAHGLPLMGCGDWNDGMNRVGRHGQGESVWLAWFLYANLQDFSHVAESKSDFDHVKVWREHAKNLQSSVEQFSWDGDWYRRAYFDDGTPLGSASNDECKIDSLAQTWAVLSQAADPARARHAMDALDRLLVKREDNLILLFTPPFDKTSHDPGYIKGYLPGVRENGGQYTHAAAWCVMAAAALKRGQKATELFSLLNPINHGRTRSEIERYKIEPYVLAGDVYSQAPHVGRGGWSWYTGSSGWVYRSGLESILGLKIQGAKLSLQPNIHPDWREYTIRYRYGRSTYVLKINNPDRYSSEIAKVTVDGIDSSLSNEIHLIDDAKEHRVEFWLGHSQT